MKKVAWIIVIIIILLMGLIYIESDEDVYSADVEIKKISFSNDSLFYQLKHWGVSSDNYELLISSNNNFQNINLCYIYHEPIFYNLKTDSLFIYCYKQSKVPGSFGSNIVVIQKELPNPEMMSLYKNYQSKGYVMLR